MFSKLGSERAVSMALRPWACALFKDLWRVWPAALYELDRRIVPEVVGHYTRLWFTMNSGAMASAHNSIRIAAGRLRVLPLGYNTCSQRSLEHSVAAGSEKRVTGLMWSKLRSIAWTKPSTRIAQTVCDRVWAQACYALEYAVLERVSDGLRVPVQSCLGRTAPLVHVAMDVGRSVNWR